MTRISDDAEERERIRQQELKRLEEQQSQARRQSGKFRQTLIAHSQSQQREEKERVGASAADAHLSAQDKEAAANNAGFSAKLNKRAAPQPAGKQVTKKGTDRAAGDDAITEKRQTAKSERSEKSAKSQRSRDREGEDSGKAGSAGEDGGQKGKGDGGHQGQSGDHPSSSPAWLMQLNAEPAKVIKPPEQASRAHRELADKLANYVNMFLVGENAEGQAECIIDLKRDRMDARVRITAKKKGKISIHFSGDRQAVGLLEGAEEQLRQQLSGHGIEIVDQIGYEVVR